MWGDKRQLKGLDICINWSKYSMLVLTMIPSWYFESKTNTHTHHCYETCMWYHCNEGNYYWQEFGKSHQSQTIGKPHQSYFDACVICLHLYVYCMPTLNWKDFMGSVKFVMYALLSNTHPLSTDLTLTVSYTCMSVLWSN